MGHFTSGHFEFEGTTGRLNFVAVLSFILDMSFIQTFRQGLNGIPNANSTPQTSRSIPKFPLTTYFSLLSYLAPLLLLSFLILPRSSTYLSLGTTPETIKRSSADRPEHPFLTPLTSNVLLTMSWNVLGMWICMIWWGQHLRKWWSLSEAGSESQTGEKEIKERQEEFTLTLNVSFLTLSIL